MAFAADMEARPEQRGRGCRVAQPQTEARTRGQRGKRGVDLFNQRDAGRR